MDHQNDSGSKSVTDPQVRALVDEVRSAVLDNRDDAVRRIDDALAIPDLVAFDRGALLMVRALVLQHDASAQDLLAMVDEAIVCLKGDEGDLLVSAVTFAAALAALEGDLEACIGRSLDFIDHLSARAGRQLPVKARANYGSTLVRLGAFQVAAEYLMEALDGVDPRSEFRVAAVAGTSLLLAIRGELVMRPASPETLVDTPHHDRLARLFEVASEIVLADEVDPKIAGLAHGIIAHVHLIRGETTAAIDRWERLESEAAKTHPIFVEYFTVTEAIVAAARGETDLAQRLVVDASDASVLEVFPTVRIETLRLKAQLLADAAQYDEAYRVSCQALALALDKPSRVPDALIREVGRRAEMERRQQLLLQRTAELDERARVDPLTGLGNRRALERFVAEMHETPSASCSVLVVDLDRFKSINDRFGHAIGDRALVHTAQVLKRVCRPSDLVVRTGGEEFLVAQRDIPLDVALRVAERIRRGVENEPWADHGIEADVTCSVGAAVGPSASVSAVIEAADEYMYVAKQSGRNAVRGGLVEPEVEPVSLD